MEGSALVLRIDDKATASDDYVFVVKHAAPARPLEHAPVLALMLLVNTAAMFNFGYTQYSMNTAQKTFYRWINESARLTYEVP